MGYPPHPWLPVPSDCCVLSSTHTHDRLLLHCSYVTAGGKGLPFFGYHIPGAATPNGAVAKNAFAIHKRMGVVLETVVPLHVAGAAGHFVRGHTIFGRINPFAAAAAGR